MKTEGKADKQRMTKERVKRLDETSLSRLPNNYKTPAASTPPTVTKRLAKKKRTGYSTSERISPGSGRTRTKAVIAPRIAIKAILR